MFWIILIWSGGIYTDEDSRFNWPLPGRLRKSEASLPGNDAASCVSWPEVSGISPAIQMKKEPWIIGKGKDFNEQTAEVFAAVRQ